MVSEKHLHPFLGITDKNKNNILEQCKEKPRTIVELERLLGLGHGTVQHHVKILKKHHLVIVERNNKEKGRPTYVKTNMVELEKITNNINKAVALRYDSIIKEILTFASNSKEVLSPSEILQYLNKKGLLEGKAYTALDIAVIKEYLGYALTPQGKEYLKSLK